jgi:hypothetical protein
MLSPELALPYLNGMCDYLCDCVLVFQSRSFGDFFALLLEVRPGAPSNRNTPRRVVTLFPFVH